MSKLKNEIKYVKVAFPLTSFKQFTYSIPQALLTEIDIGTCVQAPIRGKERIGYVVNIENFDFVFSLSAGYPGSTEWVQFACDPKNIPLSTGCTSIQVTDILPFVENSQIKGILAGMPGAAEYESLVETELMKMGIIGEPGKASSMMAAQSIAHVVIVLFIILGNITYFITRKQTGKDKI